MIPLAAFRFFWATAAEWGAAAWLERVSSAANVSESTVVGTVGAPYSFGTQQISVYFEKVLPLSSQAVRDNDFANAEVANESKLLSVAMDRVFDVCFAPFNGGFGNAATTLGGSSADHSTPPSTSCPLLLAMRT